MATSPRGRPATRRRPPQAPTARRRSQRAPAVRHSRHRDAERGPWSSSWNSQPEPETPTTSGICRWSEPAGGGTLPPMGIPLATPASRPGRRTAATLAVLLLLSACGADAGAAEQPAEGLLILTGGDAAELVVLAKKQDSDDPVAIPLPTPDGDAAWISAGKDGTLAGSTTSGALVTSGPVDPRGAAADLAGLEWQAVKASDDAGQALTTPGSFPTWDPDGQRFAALGGDLLGGGDMSLLVVDPRDGKTTSIPLKRALLAAAPAW